jgi:hypothetical protein
VSMQREEGRRKCGERTEEKGKKGRRNEEEEDEQLLVMRRRFKAASQSPLKTRSFHLGMMLPMGPPESD